MEWRGRSGPCVRRSDRHGLSGPFDIAHGGFAFSNRIGAEGAPTADAERKYLQALVTRLRECGIEADSVIEAGETPKVIAENALDMMLDLIVMSAHGKSTLEQLFLSDVVERMIRQTISPFLLLRSQPAGSREPAFARLMIAIDGSQSAEATLPYERGLAATVDSKQSVQTEN